MPLGAQEFSPTAPASTIVLTHHNKLQAGTGLRITRPGVRGGSAPCR